MDRYDPRTPWTTPRWSGWGLSPLDTGCWSQQRVPMQRPGDSASWFIYSFICHPCFAQFSNRSFFQNLSYRILLFFFLPFVARCQNYTNTAGLIPLCRWVSWYCVILILLPGYCNVCWCNCQNRKGLVSVICLMHIRHQRVANTNTANCLWEP